jgi:hypothetical protein
MLFCCRCEAAGETGERHNIDQWVEDTSMLTAAAPLSHLSKSDGVRPQFNSACAGTTLSRGRYCCSALPKADPR